MKRIVLAFDSRLDEEITFAINNLLHKYWKPVRIFTSDSFQPFGQPMRYATAEELEKLTSSKDTK
jgi:hypothetical protein